MIKLLKKLPESVINEDYKKAMDVFNTLDVSESIIIDEINTNLFCSYLLSISRLTKINGYRKTFILKKTGDNSVSVYCSSTQAL
jgi:hypothetical protein